MVYYLCGTCTSLDDLLRSGILWAHSVIILDRGHATMSEEEHMADSKQLIATETICRLFPAVNVSLELTHARNMRFMNFSLNHKRKIDANPVVSGKIILSSEYLLFIIRKSTLMLHLMGLQNFPICSVALSLLEKHFAVPCWTLCFINLL